MKKKKVILVRVYLLYILMCLVGVLVVFQSFRIQVVEGEKWQQVNDSLTTRFFSIEAERGNIFSEDGDLLATSYPNYEVRMDMVVASDELFAQNVDSLAWHLAKFFKDKTENDYRALLISGRKNSNRYLRIARKVTHPELQEIKKFPLFREGRHTGGMIAIKKNKRIKPYNMLAHRTIGYVRENQQPIGLEGQYDAHLSGQKGLRLMRKIAPGVWVPLNSKSEIEPKDGAHLVVTLDAYIQDIAENALMNTLKKYGGDHGCAIVMEVKTGKIRAIANLSLSNDVKKKLRNGEDAEPDYWERYNYAIGYKSDPGSTMKLASLLAILEDGYVDLDDSIDIGNGTIQYYDRPMKDSDPKKTGKLSVKEGFEVSSNVLVSKIINDNYANQPEKFVNHLKRIGLHKKVGIDIQGEPEPKIKDPADKTWSGTTLPWMSIGYEVELTPLQMLNFYNAVANDGKMMRPYLVSQIKQGSRVIKKIKPTVINKEICSEKTIKSLKTLLEGVVENGTARGIKSDEFKIAGKTGTNQIISKRGNYTNRHQASFAGYFPANDPVYSCVVVVRAPSKGVYYGSQVAAPVFKEIADKLYALKIKNKTRKTDQEKLLAGADEAPYIKPGYTKDIRTVSDYLGLTYSTEQSYGWCVPVTTEEGPVFKERKVVEGLVPNVTGMGLRDALYLLENSGLKVKIEGEGTGKVRKQSIRPGIRVDKNSEIRIRVS